MPDCAASLRSLDGGEPAAPDCAASLLWSTAACLPTPREVHALGSASRIAVVDAESVEEAAEVVTATPLAA
jgi:hypothetical protein